MFQMTCNCKVGSFKPFKVTSATWTRSIDNYSDVFKFKLPALCVIKTNAADYTSDTKIQAVPTGLQFTEAMKVEFECGYNGVNKTVFKGFVRRANLSVPVEIECEGYSYLIRQIKGFNKSYPSGTKMKKIVTDLVDGTEIKLSDKIADITIQTPVVFKNADGIDVLEWLKDKLLMTVNFHFDTIYVGLRQYQSIGDVKFQLNWNTIKDNDLKFDDRTEFAKVNIQIQQRSKKGQKKSGQSDSKYDDTKVVKLAVNVDQATLDAIAASEKRKLVNRGYEGAITAFLVPYVEPGMGAIISDNRYPARTGKYFISAVTGEFSKSGGRQKITIGNAL